MKRKSKMHRFLLIFFLWSFDCKSKVLTQIMVQKISSRRLSPRRNGFQPLTDWLSIQSPNPVFHNRFLLLLNALRSGRQRFRHPKRACTKDLKPFRIGMIGIYEVSLVTELLEKKRSPLFSSCNFLIQILIILTQRKSF